MDCSYTIMLHEVNYELIGLIKSKIHSVPIVVTTVQIFQNCPALQPRCLNTA